MARLRLFGPAREAAGISSLEIPGRSVEVVIATAMEQFGESFSAILATSNVWLNGEETAPEALVHDNDEIAVIPPVSGG